MSFCQHRLRCPLLWLEVVNLGEEMERATWRWGCFLFTSVHSRSPQVTKPPQTTLTRRPGSLDGARGETANHRGVPLCHGPTLFVIVVIVPKPWTHPSERSRQTGPCGVCRPWQASPSLSLAGRTAKGRHPQGIPSHCGATSRRTLWYQLASAKNAFPLAALISHV